MDEECVTVLFLSFIWIYNYFNTSPPQMIQCLERTIRKVNQALQMLVINSGIDFQGWKRGNDILT